jgi:hypothetical protein
MQLSDRIGRRIKLHDLHVLMATTTKQKFEIISGGVDNEPT